MLLFSLLYWLSSWSPFNYTLWSILFLGTGNAFLFPLGPITVIMLYNNNSSNNRNPTKSQWPRAISIYFSFMHLQVSLAKVKLIWTGSRLHVLFMSATHISHFSCICGLLAPKTCSSDDDGRSTRCKIPLAKTSDVTKLSTSRYPGYYCYGKNFPKP